MAKKIKLNYEGLKEVIDGVSLDSIKDCDKIETEGITLWIPVEYKRKFQMLQNQTSRQFSRVLKNVICQSIDRVIDEKDAI